MSLISLASKPRQQMRIHEPIRYNIHPLALKKSIRKLPPFSYLILATVPLGFFSLLHIPFGNSQYLC